MLRRFASTMSATSIGARFPAVTLFEGSPAGAVPMAELCKGKKVVVFGVPGAFTPGCSATHLPGYVKHAAAFKAKGVDELVCVSVNDPFVMAAWGKAQAADGKVRCLADTNAEVRASCAVEACSGGARRWAHARDLGGPAALNSRMAPFALADPPPHSRPLLQLAKALGLSVELGVLGGTRCKRFSALVEDGTITKLHVEPESGTGLTCSLADPLLAEL